MGPVMLLATWVVTDPGKLHLADVSQVIDVPAFLFARPEVAPEACAYATRSERAADVSIDTRFEPSQAQLTYPNSPGVIQP